MLDRRCSGQLVTSTPAMRIVPLSTAIEPAMAPCRVDFPEPFVPITTTKDPSSARRLRRSSAKTGRPASAVKCLTTLCNSSIARDSALDAPPLCKRRHDQRYKHECRRYQL